MATDPAAPVGPGPQPPAGPPGSARGILFMCGGFLSYSLSDAMAKVLSQDLPSLEIAWFRLLGLLTGVGILLAMHGPGILRSSHPLLQIGRGATAAIAVGCFVTAVTFVPLADAVAVSFVAPFIVTILAALVLREPVGPRRWFAVVLGFLGTLVVIRPGMGVLHPAIFFVVLAASAFGLRQILSRYLSGDDGTATTVAYTGLTGSALMTLALPFVWVTPEGGRVWLLLLAMACVAAAGEFLIIRALELTQAVVLAPLQYSMMIWSTIWGWLIFSQLPDLWTWVGAAIIVGSGLYTIYRDARAKGG